MADPLDLRQPVSAQPQRFQARVRFQVLNFTITLVFVWAGGYGRRLAPYRTVLEGISVVQANNIPAQPTLYGTMRVGMQATSHNLHSIALSDRGNPLHSASRKPTLVFMDTTRHRSSLRDSSLCITLLPRNLPTNFVCTFMGDVFLEMASESFGSKRGAPSQTHQRQEPPSPPPPPPPPTVHQQLSTCSF